RADDPIAVAVLLDELAARRIEPARRVGLDVSSSHDPQRSGIGEHACDALAVLTLGVSDPLRFDLHATLAVFALFEGADREPAGEGILRAAASAVQHTEAAAGGVE